MANTVIGASVEIEFQSVGNMRKALKEANQELLAMQDQFGATSQQAINAARKVADLKDRIEDARETADLFDPGKKFQAFVTLGSQIAAGFGAVQGAMALIGSESEAVEKSLLKVQSAMALAQGLSQLRDFGKSWQQLNIFIQSSSVFMKANAAANALAAGAMRMFGVAVNTTSTSFKVLKGAIVATGIGALVVAVGFVVEKLMAWANQASRTEKAIEGMNAATKKLNNSLDNQISILEAIGGKEEEIYKLRQQQANNELSDLRKTYALRNKEGKKFTDEELQRFNELKTQVIVNDINEKNRKQKVEDDKKKERDKSHATELKDNTKHNKDLDQKRQEAENARLEAENILFESRKSLMTSRQSELADLEKKRLEEVKKLDAANVKDRAAFDESYRKQKQAIDDKYNAEEKKRQEEFTKQLNKINEDIRLAGITDVREKERAQLAITHKQELDDLRKNVNLTFNERLVLSIALRQRQKQQEDALQQKFDQEDLAKKSAQLLAEANNDVNTFDQRLKLIADRKALENQIIFASDEEKKNFIKANEEAITKIQDLESKARVANAQFAADQLSALAQLAGQDTAAGKALSIAAATISTYLSAQKAYESQFKPVAIVDSPIRGAIAAAVAVATGIANIRKIISVKVPGKGGGGGTGPTPSPLTQTTSPIAPMLSPAVQGQALNAEAINNLGNTSMRAYVLNSDIQNNDQRNAYLQRNARIG